MPRTQEYHNKHSVIAAPLACDISESAKCTQPASPTKPHHLKWLDFCFSIIRGPAKYADLSVDFGLKHKSIKFIFNLWSKNMKKYIKIIVSFNIFRRIWYG